MVVARASGTDLASSLKRNTFWALGVRPVGGPRSARDGGHGGTGTGGHGGARDGGTRGALGGAGRRGGTPHAAPGGVISPRHKHFPKSKIDAQAEPVAAVALTTSPPGVG